MQGKSGQFELLKHQKWSVDFLKDADRAFDTSDAGTGKTPVQIIDFATRRRNGGGKAMIFCPLSLTESAWLNDFKKFAPDMRCVIALATNRKEAFEQDVDVYITNIDAVKWISEQPKKFFKGFETLIIDESTAYKHHTSARSKAMGKIRHYFPIRRLLSGTPTSNGICDIWHQMLLVDDGESLGTSFFAFRSACCIPEQIGNNANAIKWRDKPGIEQVVGALVEKYVIRHKFEDCVDIPPNYQYAVEYKLSPKHRKLYDQLESDAAVFVKEKSITAVNGAVLYGKLLQCASGASYSDDTEYAVLDEGRYQLIGDLIEARKHSVVFFNWRHQRDQLLRIADKAGWSYAVIDGETNKKGERERIVAAYQAGEYKVLFAHPQSAGHGLTLTRGTTTIFASPTPNLEHFLQAYKRIYRISQTEKTETIMVIAKDTIDEKVWDSCQSKNLKQLELLNYLREK